MAVQKFSRWILVAALLLVPTLLTAAPIGASGNSGNPSLLTEHNLTINDEFDITAGVALDPGAGPWFKGLRNSSPNPISSGQPVPITETLHNAGAIPWTDWHEEIDSRTTIGGGGGGGGGGANNAPGFLFANNSLSLMADYGSGFVGLAEGADYTLQTMLYSGPPLSGNNNHWEAIWIFFEPHATIQSGDTLKIEKQIFEVYGDANLWMPGETAVIRQYPTPEPATVMLLGLGALAMVGVRRGPRRD